MLIETAGLDLDAQHAFRLELWGTAYVELIVEQK